MSQLTRSFTIHDFHEFSYHSDVVSEHGGQVGRGHGQHHDVGPPVAARY